MNLHFENVIIGVFLSCLFTLTLFYDETFAQEEFIPFNELGLEEEEILEYPQLTREHADTAFKAVILGNLIHLDPAHRFIFIKPREEDLPRMYIYLDRFTQYTYSSLGVRKRDRISSLIEGNRIGVKFFTKQGVSVAEEVFIVEDDFEPLSHYDRKMYSVK